MSQPADTVRAAIRTLRDLGETVHATVNDAVTSTDRDQIAERIRDLPFQAVRLAVAGVGQAIALADKVQNLIEEQGRDKEPETEPARRPESAGRDSGRNGSVVAMPQHAKSPHAKSQANGTDEAARAQRAAARRAERPARSVPNKTAPQPAKAKPAATAKTTSAKTAAPKTTAPKKTQAKGTTPADLPVPDYDSASLASVRARLRNLTQADLRKLRTYEKANAARPAFLTMYDNRLAKLRDTSSS